MNSREYWGLMEAYSEVYAPQKEFQLWVNSLLEEGYDLSDYTWEDMYEAYLGEQGVRTGSNPNVYKPTPTSPGSRRGAAPVPSSSSTGSVTSQRGRVTGSSSNNAFSQAARSGGTRRGAAAGTRPSPTAKPPMPGLPANYRGQELQQAARARASQVGTPRQGTAGGPTTGGNTPIGPGNTPAKPTATATPRPATSATPRPTTTTTTTPRPQVKPGPTTTSTPSAPKRTFNPLMQKTFGYQTGYAPDQVKKDPKKMAQMGSLKSISSGLDMFDLVKGHLLDEGYADTEEAAIAIMANMSQEWREGILEMMGGAGGMGRMNFSMSRSSGASPRPSGTPTSNRPNTRPTNTNNTSKERIKFSNPLLSSPSSTIR